MSSYINEGVSPFKAISDFVLNINIGNSRTKSEKDIQAFKSNGALRRSSIMKASKDLVMSFPVICSDTISSENASMITKAIERNCVTTLQMLFSATYLRGENGIEAIKKWHKNIDDDISMDDYLDMVDSLARSGAIDTAVNAAGKGVKYVKGKIFETAIGTEMTEERFIAECAKELVDVHFYNESSFSEHGLNEYTISDEYSGVSVRLLCEGNNPFLDDFTDDLSNGFGKAISNTVMDPYDNTIKSYSQAQIDQKYREYEQRKQSETQRHLDAENQRDDAYERWRKEADQRREFHRADAKQRERFNNDANKWKAKQQKLNQDKLDWQKQNDMFKNSLADRQDQRAAMRDELDFFSKRLLDNDVRKCNELVPSLIVIRYNVTDATVASNALVERQFIAGVKARLYPASSREIVDKISDVFSRNKGKLGWIRATTGEISFMKDFILGIKDAKIKAKNDRLAKVSPIWRSLQYRSNKSVLKRLTKNRPNDAGAITTLVVTQEEVSYISKSLGVDLTDTRNCRKLMDAYNFMGIVIVDENFEVARFLFDGEKYFQDLSFTVLEKQTGDSSYKKVVNLISKLNRG